MTLHWHIHLWYHIDTPINDTTWAHAYTILHWHTHIQDATMHIYMILHWHIYTSYYIATHTYHTTLPHIDMILDFPSAVWQSDAMSHSKHFLDNSDEAWMTIFTFPWIPFLPKTSLIPPPLPLTVHKADYVVQLFSIEVPKKQQQSPQNNHWQSMTTDSKGWTTIES